MKLLITGAILLLSVSLFAQRSEDLVPKDAVSVFSINNINLLQKISMDDLVKYEFMEEVQQELFDGSTSDRTLKDSGIDFDQRLNIFQGTGGRFKVTGFTFGITDRNLLFEVFDDFSPMDSEYPGVDFYESYFNRIAIKGNSAILFRVEGHSDHIEKVTDSIWYAQGNDYPWYRYDYDDFYDLEEMMENTEETVYDPEEPDFFEENETEENTNTPIEDGTFPTADEDPTQKTYYELRDSVETAYHAECVKRLCDELFIHNETLIQEDPIFAKRITHNSDGVFYLDNSRNYNRERSIKYMRMLYPMLAGNLDKIYEGNVILGDLNILDHSVELSLEVGYGADLGEIYSEMTDTKFDKNVLKYIHKENNAYFTYNINMRKAYEKTFELIMPMLRSSEGNISMSALSFELMDEFINKDAVFGLYQGSMFGTYNGIKTIKTKKIVFDYDDETFEYTEKEVEAEEDMPVFTLGFTTKRNDIPLKVLRSVARAFDEVRDMGDYWIVDNGVLNTAPLYFILKNNLFIVTNDDDLALKYSSGYGSMALEKKQAKKTKKSGIMYGRIDASKTLGNLPKGIFNESENELVDVVRGKSGTMEITSSQTTKTGTNFNVSYAFDGEYENSGTYILDLINSLYVISK
ncbi:MAG: hypothetical protein ACI837_003170 [Crocinitomicaceae bacterium]|jgi:hypothetical protein